MGSYSQVSNYIMQCNMYTVPDLGNGTGNTAFSGCYAILMSPKEGETAVYGYNPALF